jgi:phosphoserine phosphatase
MMAAAGLSIAYHPKPAVQEMAMISILAGGMDRALDVLRGEAHGDQARSSGHSR